MRVNFRISRKRPPGRFLQPLAIYGANITGVTSNKPCQCWGWRGMEKGCSCVDLGEVHKDVSDILWICGKTLSRGKEVVTDPLNIPKSYIRLPREAVAAPSLEVFKTRLDTAWSNLGQWKVSLPMAGGLELHDLEDLFQPEPGYYSTIKDVLMLICINSSGQWCKASPAPIKTDEEEVWALISAATENGARSPVDTSGLASASSIDPVDLVPTLRHFVILRVMCGLIPPSNEGFPSFWFLDLCNPLALAQEEPPSPSIVCPEVICKAPVIPTGVCESGEWTHGGGVGRKRKEAGPTVAIGGHCGVGRQQEDFTIISPTLPFLGKEWGTREVPGQFKALEKESSCEYLGLGLHPSFLMPEPGSLFSEEGSILSS
ncbi:hypothetical protein WISP_55171 [Willisornis vidua]|uniref:Uncharacterized protein n=1 Tax=Willisornis vidua TaxID=1566151 RepID=A0ABQ9DHH2_9PASS|nr:hypothetical protein WISP_55171 [Willisornis vidua]